jgi:hypothetical protein
MAIFWGTLVLRRSSLLSARFLCIALLTRKLRTDI